MTYKWHSESVQINSVTIFKTEQSAQEFVDKIYPHWTDTIVVSADGAFPKDQILKGLVLNSLENRDDLPVVVFGFTALQGMKIASQKKLIMDEFLNNDMYRFDNSESVFNWNARSIAMFCFLWVSQNSNELRPSYADMRPMYNPDSVRWYNNLIYD